LNVAIETIRQLSAWLAATDIDLLELRGPGVLLRLGRDQGESTPAQESPPSIIEPTGGAVPGVTVTAPSVGVFLHAHPLHPTPFVALGAKVEAGATIGLLRIGSMLLPVRAPRAGTVAAVHVADATPVGYGTPLVALDPV
jgi:acetyl-CoA carboxylase biotin carboxyl carrier protein